MAGLSADFYRKAPERVRFIVFLVFLGFAFFGGGGSRDDILSLLYLRPVAAFCLLLFVLLPGRIDFAAVKTPFWLLVGLTLWIVLQLVPLPPALWTALPGREHLVTGGAILGLSQPWRPLSLSPDYTLDSLASMIVPLTALIGFASLSPAHRQRLLPWLLGGALVSILFILIQVSGGLSSPAYLYRVTNEGGAVGLFANRNHQAFLLVASLPMLALWASRRSGEGRDRAAPLLAAGAAAILVVLMLLVIGSRAGLILGAMAAVGAVYQFRQFSRRRSSEPREQWKSLSVALAATGAVGGVATFIAYTRAEALQRLLHVRIEGESRVEYLPILGAMVRDFLPFGSGFGTFDPAFRMREPDALLSPAYFNHAHNDLIELALTGGIPALLLLAAFVFWWARTSLRVLKNKSGEPAWRGLGVVGAVVVLILLAASLADYPLRTPLLGVVFAIACGWLGSARAQSR